MKNVFFVVRRIVCVLVFAAVGAGAAFAGGQKQADSSGWRPAKPIRIIVPWETGSSADRITRVTAAEIGKDFGVRIIIDNQSGDSGSAGTQKCLDAPRDGYTWTAGRAADLAAYKLSGIIDTNIREDWNIFLTLGDSGVISVKADSGYRDFGQLLADFKANPGQIGVAAAGRLSAGHINMELVRRFSGINYRLLAYDSAASAAAAVVSGEAQVSSLPAAEQAALIRSKKIRPLAALTASDLVLSGYGAIPSIKKWIPNFKAGLDYYGIFIPKGVSAEIIATVTRVWNEKIPAGGELKKFAEERGAVFAPAAGDTAQDKAFGWYQPVVWLYFDMGKILISPNIAGIPRP